MPERPRGSRDPTAGVAIAFLYKRAAEPAPSRSTDMMGGALRSPLAVVRPSDVASARLDEQVGQIGQFVALLGWLVFVPDGGVPGDSAHLGNFLVL